MRALVLVAVLTGCAAQAERSVVVTPQPNECRAQELHPSMFSAVAWVMCWNEHGHLVGMVGGTARPHADVPLVLLDAAATVGGAYVLGSFVLDAAKAAQIDLEVKQ